jgi:hypothetical protein
VVERERGPGAGSEIGRRLLIDIVLRAVIVMEVVIVLRRLGVEVVRVRTVVRPCAVIGEVDRRRERGAVGSVSMVGAMTHQVAHRSEDPAEHERGELNDGGLLARGHARRNRTPDRGRCPTQERRLYEHWRSCNTPCPTVSLSTLTYARRLHHGEVGKGMNDYDAIFAELRPQASTAG